MAIKVVIFDLFETLVSEFDADRPSHTEVAQTLQLPVKEFQQEYQNLRLARLTGQFSDYTAILRYIYQHVCKNLGVAPSDCIFIGDGNSDELRGAAQVGMSPFCAAWFLRQHTDLLGEDIVMRRVAGYPVLSHPSELTDRVRDICAGC